MSKDKKDDKKPEAKVETKSETKSETKVETKSEPVNGTVVTTPPVKSGALVLAKAGITIPTAQQLEQYTNDVAGKLMALNDLLNDASVPDQLKENITILIEQAQPIKPGMEEMESRGEIPRINICQPTSTKASKPEAAKNGDLYTDTGALLEKPFEFIPIYFHEENVLFPQGSKAPECKAPDAKYGQPYGLCQECPNLPFGKQNGGMGDQKQTECFAQTVVTVLSMDLQHIYDIPFAKTSYSAGRALARLARGQSVAWKQRYLLDTEKKSGERGLYYVAKIAPTGKDNDAAVLKVAKAFSELYSATRKKALAEFYSKAEGSVAKQAHAEKQFTGGGLDLGGEEGGEPDVMPDAQAGGVRTGKVM